MSSEKKGIMYTIGHSTNFLFRAILALLFFTVGYFIITIGSIDYFNNYGVGSIIGIIFTWYCVPAGLTWMLIMFGRGRIQDREIPDYNSSMSQDEWNGYWERATKWKDMTRYSFLWIFKRVLFPTACIINGIACIVGGALHFYLHTK